MRALLIANPTATSTTEKGRDVLAHALASDLKVEIAETNHRGHAAALACRAARGGVDLVVALGGDGTVNEVVNGLLTDGPHDGVPAFAVVPGGSTNVFARSLGISNDPIDATAEILAALRSDKKRRIGLGKVDSRWFTFNAGFGFDAEVVHRIERSRRRGEKVSDSNYIRGAIAHYVTRMSRQKPAITLQRPGQQPASGIHFAMVSNTSPWSYMGERAIRLNPEASFDAGLDLFAFKSVNPARLQWLIIQVLRQKPRLRNRRTITLHDLSEFTMTADRPTALQADGDYLGQRSSVTFRAVPQALTVIG